MSNILGLCWLPMHKTAHHQHGRLVNTYPVPNRYMLCAYINICTRYKNVSAVIVCLYTVLAPYWAVHLSKITYEDALTC